MLLSAFFGLAIGLVLGLTGAGGGILAVPALVIGLGMTLPEATPVALLAVGLAAAVGAADGLRKGLVRWRAALLMAALGVLLSPWGVHAAHVLPPKILMTLLATAMLAASARMLVGSGLSKGSPNELPGLDKNCMINPETGRLRWTTRCTITLASLGSVSGFLTGMLGVGGGFLIVPAFQQWTDIRMHGIVATSLMVVALVSLGATASALMSGTQLTAIGFAFIALAVVGMVCGRLAAPLMPGRRLQIGFAMLSIAVAIFLLVKSWILS